MSFPDQEKPEGLVPMSTTKSLQGSVSAMLQWFQNPNQVPDGFDADLATSFEDVGGLEARERIANEASAFEKFAVSGNTILLQTPKGRMILEVVNNGKLVIFKWAPSDRVTLWETWFNTHSVKSISDNLRKQPAKRVSFDELFVNFKTR